MDSLWIRVDDMLPSSDYDWVLISFVDVNNNKLRFVPSVAELKEGVWCPKETCHKNCFNFEKDYGVRVTHWMPLPKGPNI